MTLGFYARPQNTIGAPGFHYALRPGMHGTGVSDNVTQEHSRARGQREPTGIKFTHAREQANAIVTTLSTSTAATRLATPSTSG